MCCLRGGKYWGELHCPLHSRSPQSTCHRFCSCTCISPRASTMAELCWWEQCLALCIPAHYQYKVVVVNPDQSVGLPHCVPTVTLWAQLESRGDGWEVLNVQLWVCASVLSSGALVWVALCRTRLVPGSSAMDPPQDTAEHISEPGAPLWRCL